MFVPWFLSEVTAIEPKWTKINAFLQKFDKKK